MKIVHFGGGNIGRGAIPEIFKGIYDELIFIDPDKNLVDKINKSKEYIIKKSESLVIKNYWAIQSNDISKIINHINSCDLISTSCGFNNLEDVARIINQSKPSKKINIISFENNIRATSYLRTFINHSNDFVFIDCIIDRIVPNQIDLSSLDVFVEDYLKVVIENGQYNLSYFQNCQIVDNLDDYANLKFFGVNGLHYILAILGFNEKYQYIKDIANDKNIIKKINFYIQCLKNYILSSTSIDHNFLESYLNKNLERFLNSDLLDECSRVARNSISKLESENRIIPIIRFIINSINQSEINKNEITNLLKDLYSYKNILDNDSSIIQKSIIEIGLNATILKFSNLKL